MTTDDTTASGMRIGELALHTGVSTRSLRYYEQHGLLSAHRDRNGYRRYGDDAVRLVANLRQLLSAGLSVADIRQFGTCLTEADMTQGPCAPALEIYEQRLRVLEERITALSHLRENLLAQTERLRGRTHTPS